jgi:hypothetical protein
MASESNWGLNWILKVSRLSHWVKGNSIKIGKGVFHTEGNTCTQSWIGYVWETASFDWSRGCMYTGKISQGRWAGRDLKGATQGALIYCMDVVKTLKSAQSVNETKFTSLVTKRRMNWEPVWDEM